MVVDEPAEAYRLVAMGRDVVLIVAEGSPPLDRDRPGGRLAVMVGDPADPAVRSAAQAMFEELFPAQA